MCILGTSPSTGTPCQKPRSSLWWSSFSRSRVYYRFSSGTCACGVSSDKPVQNPRSDDLALCFTQVSVVLTLGFSELGSPRSFFCIWMSCRHRTTCHTVSAFLSGFLGLSGTQLPRSPGAVSQWVCASMLLPLYLKTPMRMDQGPPQ